MIIRTERLILTPMSKEHLSGVCRYAMDKDATKYMVNLPCDDEAEVMRYLIRCENEMKKEQPMFYEFAVFFGDEHAGAVDLYFEGSPDPFSCGELGWILDRRFWGMGLAAEAANGVIHCFNKQSGLRHFIAHCDSENTASRRVMEKLGMKLVDISSGRKNRSSDEIRKEYMFELFL